MRRRTEDIAVNTPEWRRWAEAGFTTLRRGSQAQCARALKVDRAEVNRLIKGERQTSTLVRRVTRWLERQGVPAFEPSRAVRGTLTGLNEIQVAVLLELDKLPEAEQLRFLADLRHLAGRSD